jgi:predicted dehydrogenase
MDFYHYADEEHRGWFFPLEYEHFDVEYNHPLQAEADHFIDLCQGRETTPRCTGEDGMRTLKIVNAMIESADSGQVVSIA